MNARQDLRKTKLRSCLKKIPLCTFAHFVIDNQCVIKILRTRNCALFAHFCATIIDYVLLGTRIKP